MPRKSRSQINKKSGGLFSKVWKSLIGEKSPDMQSAVLGEKSAAVSEFSEIYNDVPLNGDIYVSNICCRTVGEYKAQCLKKYGPQ